MNPVQSQEQQERFVESLGKQLWVVDSVEQLPPELNRHNYYSLREQVLELHTPSAEHNRVVDTREVDLLADYE
ncbi:MAG TPA: hypothetical protein PKA06_12580 [Gemmatales bacterium]|nr:hypothetical protein [Gemmatales bacterium]